MVENYFPDKGNQKHYAPFFVLCFLTSIKSQIVPGVTVTKFKIMKHLVKCNYVLLWVNSLYILCKEYLAGNVPLTVSWSKLSKKGRRPYFDSREILELISEIQKQCEGGMVISITELKDFIAKAIYKKYSKKHQLHLLKVVPDWTLNAYANVVKSQGIFSLYSSVSNKSESCAVAEWSLCSTISYLMAVRCVHFIPAIEQIMYHPKKKKLSKDKLELWNIV